MWEIILEVPKIIEAIRIILSIALPMGILEPPLEEGPIRHWNKFAITQRVLVILLQCHDSLADLRVV